MSHWDKGDYRDKIIIAMIESKSGVDALPEILELGGIDVFYFGQNDLAESMGLKGDRKNPKVRALVEDGIKRVADAGKVAGMNVQDEIDSGRALHGHRPALDQRAPEAVHDARLEGLPQRCQGAVREPQLQ